jgi:hypothetical protein
MSPNQWPEPDGSPQPSHHQTALDRQMIRHLASRYSPEELSRLFQEEGNGSSSASEFFFLGHVFYSRGLPSTDAYSQKLPTRHR